MPADAVPVPGSPTVPPLFGWEGIVLVLFAVLLVGVAFLVIGALATTRRRRSPEWQAWLDGRSRSRLDPDHGVPVPRVRGTAGRSGAPDLPAPRGPGR